MHEARAVSRLRGAPPAGAGQGVDRCRERERSRCSEEARPGNALRNSGRLLLTDAAQLANTAAHATLAVTFLLMWFADSARKMALANGTAIIIEIGIMLGAPSLAAH